jgi:hypothetical protein
MFILHRCWFCGDLATQGPFNEMYACDAHAHWLEDEEAS